MTDTITESFCERCGTRYALEQTGKRRRGGIGRVRVLTRGLRNYVANDGMPMAEALAAARSDEERSGVTRQLDAFHKTFNFCMTCRQYTCGSCWNATAGECLTCAPDLSREVLPLAFPDLPLEGPTVDANGHHESVEATAWPRVDLDRGAPVKGAPGASVPADEAPAAQAPELAVEATAPEPLEPAVEAPEVLARLDSSVAAVPAERGSDDLTPRERAEIENALAATHAEAGPAPAAAEATAPEAEAVVGFEPEAEAVAAAEATAPEAAGATETEVVAAAAEVTPPQTVAAIEPAAEATAAEVAEAEAPMTIEPEAAPVTAPEPTTTTPAERAVAARRQTRSLLSRFRPARSAAPAGAAAAAPREPTAAAPREPTVAAPPQQPGATTESAPPAPTSIDIVEQPTWRITAPDVASAPPPIWPEAPAWPAPSQVPPQPPGSAAAPWAARLATSRPETAAGVWAASSQEVLGGPAAPAGPGAVPAVQACVSCGLSLSANARFCRRCGSRQG